MGVLNLKIKHKLLLLLVLQVALVSIFIIGSSMHLSKEGKKKVLYGVTENLEDLAETSIAEFNEFTTLANEGIRQASGLAAIDQITSIALDNQEKLAAVIGEAMESIRGDVSKTLESQDVIVNEGLDDLLAGSTDSMNEIINADQTSQEVLANMATYNMASLNASVLDSLERFTLLFGSLEKELQEMESRNSDEMDQLLIAFITMQQDVTVMPEQILDFVMESLGNLKKNSADRKNNLFVGFYDAFDEQKKVMNEELKLVNKKIRYAIQMESGYVGVVQNKMLDQVINRLLENQMTVMDKMSNVSELLKQTVAQFKTSIPLKLKMAGEEAGNKIKAQTADASKLAENAHLKVVDKVNTNMKAAVAKFETGIEDSKVVIERTLDKSSRKTMGYSFAIAAICTFAAGIIGFFVTRSITVPLTRVVSLTEKMAEGDFTQTIDIERKDEIGQLLVGMKNMAERLRETVHSVSDATDSVNTSALEISSMVQEQASITAEQSSSVSEISATIEEFSQSSSQIAQNAAHVSKIATNTLQETEKGVEASKAMVMRMNEISQENQRSIDEIVALGKKSKAITKFMAIINNIADQTKLIAFNAALEAASTGEAGKRFGVVADEIRRLADSVMESTGEIEMKINEIQEAFSNLGIASEEGSKKVREGMEASSRNAKMLENLLAEAQITEGAAKQISLSTQQQKTASEQVVIALQEIAAGAKKSTVSINQANTISTNLAELSGSLKNMVGKFKVGQ